MNSFWLQGQGAGVDNLSHLKSSFSYSFWWNKRLDVNRTQVEIHLPRSLYTFILSSCSSETSHIFACVSHCCSGCHQSWQHKIQSCRILDKICSLLFCAMPACVVFPLPPSFAEGDSKCCLSDGSADPRLCECQRLWHQEDESRGWSSVNPIDRKHLDCLVPLS